MKLALWIGLGYFLGNVLMSLWNLGLLAISRSRRQARETDARLYAIEKVLRKASEQNAASAVKKDGDRGFKYL